MDQKTWLKENAVSLKNKTVALTGATGGLGKELSRAILAQEGTLVMLTRNHEKTMALKKLLLQEYPGASIREIPLELTDLDSVKAACEALRQLPLDVLIHNAGAYSVPRFTCTTGLDNVFQTNFAAPYYMTKQLLPLLEQRRGKVVAVGSIAHTYSHTDPEDMDFAGRDKPSLVYGNSKRYLMFALGELLKDNASVRFAIGHPGITLTNITSHYPEPLYSIIKPSMKLTFMKPQQACRGIVFALCHKLPYLSWAGPALFDIWGDPNVKHLSTCDKNERMKIFISAENMYKNMI